MVNKSQPKYQSRGRLKYLNVINATPLLGIYINQKEHRWLLIPLFNTLSHFKTKILKVDYLLHFVDIIILLLETFNLQRMRNITPPTLLDKDKPFILIDIPFCKKNENDYKDFIKIRVTINWITKKLKSSFY